MTHPVVLEFERPLVELERKIHEREARGEGGAEHVAELERLRRKADAVRRKILEQLTPWQRVQIARHPGRPRPFEVVSHLVQDFVELSGDRVLGEDAGLVAGLGFLDRRRVALLAHGRGRAGAGGRRWTLPPTAVGLRKASRVVELAARFDLPLITLVDTAADDAVDPLAEARLGPALTELLALLADLPGPSVAVILGEAYGTQGVALALADRILCLEHAVCAPVAPEDCALLEVGDSSRASVAAANLRLTAEDAQTLGFADAVIPEPPGGAHHAPKILHEQLGSTLRRELASLRSRPVEDRLAARRARLQTLTRLIAVDR